MARKPTSRPDPRLTDPRYDFRFFGPIPPIEQARERLSIEFRVANAGRSGGRKMNANSRARIAYANRMMWAARNQEAILAALVTL